MSTKQKHPRAWGAKWMDGQPAPIAEQFGADILERGWEEKRLVRVRIVPESDYRRLRKIERVWSNHVCPVRVVYRNGYEDEE